MLPLLLMVLLSAGVLSQPVQQNCKAVEPQFRKCVGKAYLKEKDNQETFHESMRIAVVECGPQQWDCYTQKKLIKMIDEIISIEKENVAHQLDSEGQKCLDEMKILHEKKCFRTAMFDKHGFYNDVPYPNDFVVNLYICLAEHSKTSEYCKPEDAEKILAYPRGIRTMTISEELKEFFKQAAKNEEDNI